MSMCTAPPRRWSMQATLQGTSAATSTMALWYTGPAMTIPAGQALSTIPPLSPGACPPGITPIMANGASGQALPRVLSSDLPQELSRHRGGAGAAGGAATGAGVGTPSSGGTAITKAPGSTAGPPITFTTGQGTGRGTPSLT